MKLTIIPSDKAVYKDGVCYHELALVGIPDDVHALQWEETIGHIEYKKNSKPNQEITELPQWALDALTVWQSADDARVAEELAQQQSEVLP